LFARAHNSVSAALIIYDASFVRANGGPGHLSRFFFAGFLPEQLAAVGGGDESAWSGKNRKPNRKIEGFRWRKSNLRCYRRKQLLREECYELMAGLSIELLERWNHYY
jgi:hypothetical protein